MTMRSRFRTLCNALTSELSRRCSACTVIAKSVAFHHSNVHVQILFCLQFGLSRVGCSGFKLQEQLTATPFGQNPQICQRT